MVDVAFKGLREHLIEEHGFAAEVVDATEVYPLFLQHIGEHADEPERAAQTGVRSHEAGMPGGLLGVSAEHLDGHVITEPAPEPVDPMASIEVSGGNQSEYYADLNCRVCGWHWDWYGEPDPSLAEVISIATERHTPKHMAHLAQQEG